MRPLIRALRGVVLVLIAALLLLIMYDLVRQPAAPDYQPVVRETALDARPMPQPKPCGSHVERLLVVGWDGVGWDRLLPALGTARLPNLAKLLRSGSHGNLYGFKPSLSPALWTTIATGRSPADHGIRRFDKRPHRLIERWNRIRRLGKRHRELYSNADRREPALWNLLSDRGETSLIVGYHNSYPAEAIEGLMLSNWLVRARMEETMRATSSAPPRLVHPPETTAHWLELQREIDAQFSSRLGEFVNADDETLRQLVEQSTQLGEQEERWPYFLRRAWIDDAFHARVVTEVLARTRPRLTMVHFQAVDLVQHELFAFSPTVELPAWPELDPWRSQYDETIDRFLERADRQLGELITAAGDNVTVLLLSDHGFEASDDPWGSGSHDEAPPGLWIASGPGVRTGVRQNATHYDIFPTLAAALDLPLSSELPGAPMAELFCQEAEVETVKNYGAFTPPIAAPPPYDETELDALRSLGYVE